MIPAGLDKSISLALALLSGALGYWAHRREISREKKKALADSTAAAAAAKQKYADRELKAYAAQRDFGHIQKDLLQLKANTDYLMKEGDQRLDDIERRLEKLTGTVEALRDVVKAAKTSPNY